MSGDGVFATPEEETQVRSSEQRFSSFQTDSKSAAAGKKIQNVAAWR
jgi:hypothetical protein